MANCKSRCNFYFKVQGRADLGRCGPVNQQYFTPSSPADPAVLARSGPVRRRRAGGCTEGVHEAARRSNDHRRPAPNLVAHRPGRARCAPARGDSQVQHRAPAYRRPHCFPRTTMAPAPSATPALLPPATPTSALLRRGASASPTRIPAAANVARARTSRSVQIRRDRRGGVLNPSINHAPNHGICGWVVTADRAQPRGHYSACVMGRPDVVSGSPGGAQIYRLIAANSPQRDA
jgi:hypothetical protein